MFKSREYQWCLNQTYSAYTCRIPYLNQERGLVNPLYEGLGICLHNYPHNVDIPYRSRKVWNN